MRMNLLVLSFAGLLALQSASAAGLRADGPAAKWDQAYPVGNGSLGGMNMGAFPEERIVLNHDTIWSKPRPAPLAPGCRTNDMAEA